MYLIVIYWITKMQLKNVYVNTELHLEFIVWINTKNIINVVFDKVVSCHFNYLENIWNFVKVNMHDNIDTENGILFDKIGVFVFGKSARDIFLFLQPLIRHICLLPYIIISLGKTLRDTSLFSQSLVTYIYLLPYTIVALILSVPFSARWYPSEDLI